jgi:hypothetical protein
MYHAYVTSAKTFISFFLLQIVRHIYIYIYIYIYIHFFVAKVAFFIHAQEDAFTYCIMKW